MEKKGFKDIKYLAFAGLLVALDIVLTRLFSFEIIGVERVSFQFLPHALAGLMFGPFGAPVITVAGDLIGMALVSKGLSINPILTLNVALKGFLYGLFFSRLKKKELKPAAEFLWILLSFAVVTTLCDIVINSFIMHFMFNVPVSKIFMIKIPVRAVSIPVYAVLYWALYKGLLRAGVFFKNRRQK